MCSRPTVRNLLPSLMASPRAPGGSRPPTATLPNGSMRQSRPCARSSPRITARGAMAQVNVTINGHQYRMACLDGQEDHLLGLAKGFSERIERLRAQFGEVGDMRLTIMAAITVTDELSEAAAKVRRLEQEITAGEQAKLVAAERAQVTQ